MLARVEIYFRLILNSDLQGIGSYAVVGTKVEKICLVVCTRVWPISGDEVSGVRTSPWVIRQKQEPYELGSELSFQIFLLNHMSGCKIQAFSCVSLPSAGIQVSATLLGILTTFVMQLGGSKC